MTRETIARLLPGHPWQQQLVVLDCVDSTNNFANSLAAQGAPHGTAVLALAQTGGKGRLGRQFSSPRDMGVYCSVILRFDRPPEQLLCLTPVMAEAVRRGLTELTGLDIGIKWTNDLVCEKKKLCGILTEVSVSGGRVSHVILGVGVNCMQLPEDFPPEVASMATSLHQLLGREIDRSAVAAAILRQISAAAAAFPDGSSRWMADYKAHCVTLGQDVKIVRGDRVQLAHVDDMTEQGALLVTLSDGTTDTVLSGEVSVRGMYGYL